MSPASYLTALPRVLRHPFRLFKVLPHGFPTDVLPSAALIMHHPTTTVNPFRGCSESHGRGFGRRGWKPFWSWLIATSSWLIAILVVANSHSVVADSHSNKVEQPDAPSNFLRRCGWWQCLLQRTAVIQGV